MGDESFLGDDDDDEIEKALDTEDGAPLIRQDLKGPKAKKADKCPTCGGDMDADGDCPDDYHTAKTGADTVDTQKADLSAEARSNLDSDQFACPEKRKYPIGDKAHVRAALSRIADPSNDQCGRSKIIAAARKMGIGEHSKAASDTTDLITKSLSDEELLAEAATWSTEITTDPDGFEVIAEKSAEESATPISEPTDGQASDTPEGVSPETPETASEDDTADEQADSTEKALSFEAVDVVTLAMKARDLAQAVNDRDEMIETLKAERDTLAAENEVAKQIIEKVMAQPLRAKTAGYVTDAVSTRLPNFLAPEVRELLTKDSGGTQ